MYAIFPTMFLKWKIGVLDVSLQLEKEQRKHVAGLLHLQVIHVGGSAKALP